jgi:hypothetical protein
VGVVDFSIRLPSGRKVDGVCTLKVKEKLMESAHTTHYPDALYRSRAIVRLLHGKEGGRSTIRGF